MVADYFKLLAKKELTEETVLAKMLNLSNALS